MHKYKGTAELHNKQTTKRYQQGFNDNADSSKQWQQ